MGKSISELSHVTSVEENDLFLITRNLENGKYSSNNVTLSVMNNWFFRPDNPQLSDITYKKSEMSSASQISSEFQRVLYLSGGHIDGDIILGDDCFLKADNISSNSITADSIYVCNNDHIEPSESSYVVLNSGQIYESVSKKIEQLSVKVEYATKEKHGIVKVGHGLSVENGVIGINSVEQVQFKIDGEQLKVSIGGKWYRILLTQEVGVSSVQV